MKRTAFEPSYTAITKDGAEWIVQQGSIKLVGIDYLSVAHYADLIGPHVALLGQVCSAPPLTCQSSLTSSESTSSHCDVAVR